MKPLGIGHDYAHCFGGECPMKEKCIRYLLYLEAKEMGLIYVPYIDPWRDGDNCNYYWEKK